MTGIEEYIGAQIFAGLYSIGVPGAIADFIGSNALILAATAASVVAGLPRGGASAAAQNAKNTLQTAEGPLYEAIGRDNIGGTLIYGNTDGSNRYRLLARARGPVDEIEEFYVGGREVIVDDDGNVTSPPWRKTSGGSWLNFDDKHGDGTETAWAALLSAFPGIWSSDHRVRGLAQSLLVFGNPGLSDPEFLKLYQSGIPETTQIRRWSRIYDCRDAGQDAATPSTWTWNDNAANAIVHLLRRDANFWPPENFNWEKIAEFADVFDAGVMTRAGTVPRGRLWGRWSYEEKRGDTLTAFLRSAGAQLRTDADGLIYVEPIDDLPVAEVSLTDADILTDQWQSGPEAVERPNICRLKYKSPERKYELTEINLDGIGWAIIQDEVDRYGEKYFDVELPYCPDSGIAQRIARLLFALERADRYSCTLNQAGMALCGVSYCDIATEYDDAPVLMRVDSVTEDAESGVVSASMTVWPILTPWVVATDEAEPPTVLPELGYSSDLAQPNAPTALICVRYPVSGTYELRLAYDIPETHDEVEAVVRIWNDGLPTRWKTMAEIGNFAWLTVSGYPVTCDGRVRYILADDISNFSDILSASAVPDNSKPSAPTNLTLETSASGTTATITGNVSCDSVQSVGLKITRRVGVSGTFEDISLVDTRPQTAVAIDDSAGGSFDEVITWRFYAVTTDGTLSDPLELSQTTDPVP